MRKIILIICTLFFVLNIFIVSASITISDNIVEKQTKFYNPGFKAYEVTLGNADDTGVRFIINGQLTRLLNTGDFYIISDVNISVNDIHRQGNTYVANFTIFIAGCHRCDYGMSCPEENCCNGKDIKDINFTSDNENCGSCGYKCKSGYSCNNTKCTSTKSNNDLSNYPSFLTKYGNELVFVVGDKSSSINVVAQTYILSSLSGINKKNKLASEVTDLNQNIISIGNPCVNEISAKIMNNPEPCDKDFERGTAYIKLYKNNGLYHLIVAGYTDLGTRKAAEILANYQDYKFQGNEYVIEFSGDTGERLIEEKKEEAPKTGATEQESKIETGTKTEVESKVDIKIEPKIEQKVMENKTKEKVAPKAEEQNQTEKSDNIINKFISWFLSLFKK
ncbi:hypothetical protein HYX00_00525 [Candidatus Woesearchaeota archaeon]|nr:hypothetical protein [Candidatus Woesearchaeota archaeon]